MEWYLWVMFGLLFLILISMLVITIIAWTTTVKTLEVQYRAQSIVINHLSKTRMNVLVHINYGSNYSKTTLDVLTLDNIKTEITKVMASSDLVKTDPFSKVAELIAKSLSAKKHVLGVSVEILVPESDDSVTTATFTEGNAPRLLEFDSIKK